ncbi:hypothetical protein EV424DRAFT_1346554 [Suillus variegatus]|nr:hypothetical protein EV424DRAFT_1346554 [Suillus variegatus]
MQEKRKKVTDIMIDKRQGVKAGSGSQQKDCCKRWYIGKEVIQQPKCVKGNQSASNLNPDWCKTVGQLAKKTACADKINTNLILEVGRSGSSSQASSRSSSRLTPESSSDLVVGEFDIDEPEETIAAAQEHKSNKVKDVKTSGSASAIYCTTAGMGLKINKKGADDAVKEEVKAVKMLKLQKPLRMLKLKDLPLQDKSNRDIWNCLVCVVIDWAGTTTDLFGTNEHPELSPKLQELWNVFLNITLWTSMNTQLSNTYYSDLSPYNTRERTCIISCMIRASGPWAHDKNILDYDGWAGRQIIPDGGRWAHAGNI